MSENPYQPPSAKQDKQRNRVLIWIVALVALAAIAFFGLVCAGAAMWFVVRDRAGQEVGRIQVPDGAVVPQPVP